jgi:hypothetical protein
MSEAGGEFNVTHWDEETYAELENGKLTRGRGELSGIGGAGAFDSPREGTTTYYLSYDLG